MKIYKLKDMTRGWFVGKFIPTAFSTELCEVAVKKYKEGDIIKGEKFWFKIVEINGKRIDKIKVSKFKPSLWSENTNAENTHAENADVDNTDAENTETETLDTEEH